jgi:hypothetical protein
VEQSARVFDLPVHHTDEEYLEYVLWQQLDVPGYAQKAMNSRASGRALIVLGLIFVFLLVLTFAFNLGFSPRRLFDNWELLSVLAAIGLSAISVGWTFFVRGDRKRLEAWNRRQIRKWRRKHGPDAQMIPHGTIRLDETGISWITNGTTTSTAWTAFTRMERKKHGVSLGSPSMWMYVPLSSLRAPGVEGAESFLETCAVAAGLDEASQVLKYITATQARCPKCNYELSGISRPICPECGEKLSFESFQEVFYPHKARPRSFAITG